MLIENAMDNKPKPLQHGRQGLRTFSALVCLLLMTTSLFAQEKTVTGTVTDSTNEPLIGASVVIQGTSNGTITDIDGKYSITASPDNVLEFSYVGMVKQDVKVGSQHVINIQLKEDSQMLAETVVIGYGSAKKRDLTGSITNIKGAEIANKPSTNPLSSLQGKVAGVQIINSGQAGSDPEIRVRGTNSINGYKPLYIVDGLFNDNINFLNPEDIESMEVLKDPSSLAIFGVRGANGVIIITTKKAKEGQTLVNINTSFGWKHVVDRIKMVNASQFKELYSEQLVNEKNPAFDFSGWNADTDWQDEVLQNGFITNNNGTGKTEVSQFKENETKVQSDYVLTYTNSFGDHNLTATAGFTTYYNSLSRLDAARGQGIGLVIPDNPDKWFVSIGDLATATNGSTQWERTTVSFLGRVIYNYKGKYLFNGSFRRDGSSAFSYTGNQWQNFYSAGAGWLMTEEEFMKDISWLDMLKLKGSWGTLGNQNLHP